MKKILFASVILLFANCLGSGYKSWNGTIYTTCFLNIVKDTAYFKFHTDTLYTVVGKSGMGGQEEITGVNWIRKYNLSNRVIKDKPYFNETCKEIQHSQPYDPLNPQLDTLYIDSLYRTIEMYDSGSYFVILNKENNTIFRLQESVRTDTVGMVKFYP